MLWKIVGFTLVFSSTLMLYGLGLILYALIAVTGLLARLPANVFATSIAIAFWVIYLKDKK